MLCYRKYFPRYDSSSSRTKGKQILWLLSNYVRTVLTYKALHNTSPQYRTDFVHICSHRYNIFAPHPVLLFSHPEQTKGLVTVHLLLQLQDYGTHCQITFLLLPPQDNSTVEILLAQFLVFFTCAHGYSLFMSLFLLFALSIPGWEKAHYNMPVYCYLITLTVSENSRSSPIHLRILPWSLQQPTFAPNLVILTHQKMETDSWKDERNAINHYYQ